MRAAKVLDTVKGLAAVVGIVLAAVTFAVPAPAADGPALPPAAYKPLPVGTKIKSGDEHYEVVRSDGYSTAYKIVGRGRSFLNAYGLFAEFGDNLYVRDIKGGTPVEYSLADGSEKQLQAFWPLSVGKETSYRLSELATQDSPPQLWTIALKVLKTEVIDIEGDRYATYVVEERAKSDGGMSFSGRKWYHPESGLILRSTITWTGDTAFGPWKYKVSHWNLDQTESYTPKQVTFPPGTTANVLAGKLARTSGSAMASAAQAMKIDGAASPPVPFKPLPVGTRIEYDDHTETVAKSDGFMTLFKRQVGGTTTWVPTHALFGEYAADLYVTATRGEAVEYELDERNRKKLEALWPLAIGKATSYELRELPGWEGVAQTWTISLKVSGTESIDVANARYRAYVIEERAVSDGGMAFDGRKWYHPETGLIVQATRLWTKAPSVGGLSGYYKWPKSVEGAEKTFALRKVNFPPGTETPVIAAAPATATEIGASPTDKSREGEIAGRLKQADEARKAEIAQLKQEAEQALKARETEMANRLKQVDEARQAREAEIAKLKQEAEQALKSREAEIARLKQSLDERRGDKTAKAGTAGPAVGGVEFGRYHALVIGIDNYKQLPKLKTAVNDARAIAQVLEKDYGFTVTLLLEPTRNEIVDALDVYRESLGPTDNLLIYYAGHGWLDKEVDRGYWLPIDAEPKRRRDWVSNATVTDTLKALNAKHVMVIADSCYSGTLVRGTDVGARARTGDYWKTMAGKWARVAITSGGLEPVADAGGGSHSPFAKAFIDALRDNASVMDGTQLFSTMRRPVMVSARQTPQYADVREAGHDGGDFLFVRKK